MVWCVDIMGMIEIGWVSELLWMNDWWIDGWSGESCIDLLVVFFEDLVKVLCVCFCVGLGKDGWYVVCNVKGCVG